MVLEKLYYNILNVSFMLLDNNIIYFILFQGLVLPKRIKKKKIENFNNIRLHLLYNSLSPY